MKIIKYQCDTCKELMDAPHSPKNGTEMAIVNIIKEQCKAADICDNCFHCVYAGLFERLSHISKEKVVDYL